MKKALIISYYWPPAGGISVHRSLKIVKYLRNFGWEPVVFTPENAHYSYNDEGNFRDVPENLTVLRNRILEPFKIFKLLSGRNKNDSLNNIVHVRTRRQTVIDKIGIWIRANFFIPDARSLWIPRSVKYLVNYLQKNPVDIIFADGPPHTNNVIAMRVSKKTGIPYLADFQDPWTQVDYYQLFPFTRRADKKHRSLEQEVFKQASKITIASPSWKHDLEKIGARNVEVLYWGYDEEDFIELQPETDSSFSFTHTGLLGYDRNPVTLFKILKELSGQDNEFKSALKLNLIGQVDYSVHQSIREAGLEDFVHEYGIISRKKTLEIAMGSSVLLLLLNKAFNSKGRLPGKLYEYLKIRRPVLGLGMKGSDAEKILHETGAGSFFDYEDHENIKKFILNAFIKYKKGRLDPNQGNIEKYSILNQVRKLAEFFNEIIEN
jgi:hypothetical protein